MRKRTHGHHTMMPEYSAAFDPITFKILNLYISVTFFYWQVFFGWVMETNETINLQAHFFIMHC